MSILGSLIENEKVDDLKALVVVAKAGLIEVDVETSKLLMETAKNKFNKAEEAETNSEIKVLLTELIDLLQTVNELIPEDEAEEVSVTSAYPTVL